MNGYALIGPAYPLRGGIAQYGSSLYLELSKRRRVQFISYRRQYPRLLFPGKTQQDLSAEPLVVPSTPILNPLSPVSWERAVRAIRRDPPQVVLVMWWNPFFSPMLTYICRRIRAQLRVPVVFLCHNVNPHESTLLDRFLLRMAFAAPTHFIVQSQVEKQRLCQMRPGVPVEVVYHPSQSFFRKGAIPERESARRELMGKGILPREKPVIAGRPATGPRNILLYFGHVRPYKGVDILLQAMQQVVRQESVELLIAGEFYEDRSKYDHLIRKLDLQPFVSIIDRYLPNEEVSSFFAAADALVLPYRSATQSGVLPLAYQFERPVIVTRVGGIPEALEEGVTGLLVEPESPDALAVAIVQFFKQDLGSVFKPNLKPAAERMSWGSLVDRLEAFIQANPLPKNFRRGK
jgi:glycosyltransferase involved in cell wall biosynthesis